jgi:catechol 2,3-dioxygenase-like lactoylglutathione lyase family enzyme
VSENRIHHLACGTRDVERLARFYCEVLGLPEVARHFDADGSLRSIWLDLGACIFMIEKTRSEPAPVSGVGAGFFLLALRVSPEERSGFESRLGEAGVRIESRSEWTSYARDPDGNRIALSHYPKEALTGEVAAKPG